jgi:transposase-like protein
MPARYQLVLSEEQVKELTWTRDHHAMAYLRVKAAALLKVAQGEAISQVARSGLLKGVDRHTIKDWIVRYQQDGLAGLKVQTARGRKPAFSPSLRRRRTGRRRPAGDLAPRASALRGAAQ